QHTYRYYCPVSSDSLLDSMAHQKHYTSERGLDTACVLPTTQNRPRCSGIRPGARRLAMANKQFLGQHDLAMPQHRHAHVWYHEVSRRRFLQAAAGTTATGAALEVGLLRRVGVAPKNTAGTPIAVPAPRPSSPAAVGPSSTCVVREL